MNASASRWIHIAGLLLACLYGVIALLSRQFLLSVDTLDRPLLTVIGLFGAASAIYAWVCLRVIGWPKQPTSDEQLTKPNAWRAIVIWAIVFRAILIGSLPIQEVDLYRYLWDGTVTCQGISPFQYSPASVLAAADSPSDDADLDRLAGLVQSNSGIRETLQRVHFGELPTVYPSTSQAVFALAYATTPTTASVDLRALVLKLWLLMFDLGTMALVMICLRLLGKPIAWCILYAWCPLILKEITNSGHLDIIAVFFTTLALTALVRLIKSNVAKPAIKWIPSGTGLSANAWGMLACGFLGLAVGAKLYPIVLTPLFVGILLKQQGWRSAGVGGVIVVGLSFLLLYPMLPGGSPQGIARTAIAVAAMTNTTEVEGFNRTCTTARYEDAIGTAEDGSKSGNDGVLDSLGDERLSLHDCFRECSSRGVTSARPPWFAIMPRSFRTKLTGAFSGFVNKGQSETAFLIARGLTAAVFILVAFAIAWKAMHRDDPDRCGCKHRS